MNYVSTMGRTAHIKVNGDGDYKLLPFVPESVLLQGYLSVLCELPDSRSKIQAMMDARGRVTLTRFYHPWVRKAKRTARIITQNFVWRDTDSPLVIEVRAYTKKGCTLRISGVPVFLPAQPEPAAPGTTQ